MGEEVLEWLREHDEITDCRPATAKFLVVADKDFCSLLPAS